MKGRETAEKSLIVVAAEAIPGNGSRIGRIRLSHVGDIKRQTLHGFINQSVEPGSTVATECVEAMQTGMGDFEDAVAAICAGRVRADFIVTRDAEFAQKGCSIPVVRPTEILRRVE